MATQTELSIAHAGQQSEIRKFGQEVRLEVKIGNEVKLRTDGLRVDFKILQVHGYNRAEFKIYNLDKGVIRDISGVGTGISKTVSLWTQLHGRGWELLARDMYLSNAYNEIVLPNSILSLYCFSNLRVSLTEKQVNATIGDFPSLNDITKSITTASGVSFSFRDFPDSVRYSKSTKPFFLMDGSLAKVLERLSVEFFFQYYLTDSGNVILLFLPEVYNVRETDFFKNPAGIVLDVNNMKATPIMGASSIQIISNLDPAISVTSSVDVSKLLTATTELGIEALAAAQDILRQAVTGFSKYQIITVEHSGSNYTSEWETKAYGVTPTAGNTMRTDFNWYG